MKTILNKPTIVTAKSGKQMNNKALNAKVYRCRKRMKVLHDKFEIENDKLMKGCVWSADDCHGYYYDRQIEDFRKHYGITKYRQDWMDTKVPVSYYRNPYDNDVVFRDTYQDVLREIGYHLVMDVHPCSSFAPKKFRKTDWYLKPLDHVIKEVAEDEQEKYEEEDEDGDVYEASLFYPDLILPTPSQYKWGI